MSEEGMEAVARPPPKRPENEDLESVTRCPSCDKRFILFTKKSNCLGCGKVYCSKCLNSWIYFPEEYQYDTVQPACTNCFKELSSIDHSVHFEHFGFEEPDSKTLILIHPGTLTRQFWNWHASILSQKYRVFAIDLPGHGSRMGERLSVTSAHEAIISLIKEVGVAGKKVVLWGHGVGGYVAISFSGIYPQVCSGIIASNCGAPKDERKSAVWMAKQSLTIPVTKNSTLAQRPLIDLKFNQISAEMVVQNFLRPGTYYSCWDGILETVCVANYLELLRNFPGKIFFINGSNCERDAEERFVGAAQEASLEIIDGADDWFIVDERYRERALELVDDFMSGLDWNQQLEGIDFSFENVPLSDEIQRDEDQVLVEPGENYNEEQASMEHDHEGTNNRENIEDNVKNEEREEEPQNKELETEEKNERENMQPLKKETEIADHSSDARQEIEESDEESEDKGLPAAIVVENLHEEEPSVSPAKDERSLEIEDSIPEDKMVHDETVKEDDPEINQSEEVKTDVHNDVETTTTLQGVLQTEGENSEDSKAVTSVTEEDQTNSASTLDSKEEVVVTPIPESAPTEIIMKDNSIEGEPSDVGEPQGEETVESE